MWKVENETQFEAAGEFIRDMKGRENWVVAIKATFDILPDSSLEPAKEQLAPNHLPVYFGEEAKSSLQYESDFPLDKQNVDIILNASAHSPYQEPVKELNVSISLGSISKSLKIIGDRYRVKPFLTKSITDAEEFTSMEIRYEKAYGGWLKNQKDIIRDNPIGTGSENIEYEQLPNIFYPGKKNKVAGFGAIAGDWQPRLSLAGTYDEKWQNERFPLIPTDFDNQFYQFAPLDQQVKSIVGGEQVILENLTPKGNLRFAVPEKQFQCFSCVEGEIRKHSTKLSTIILEPDFPRIIMVWHSRILCNKEDHLLEYTYVKEER